MKYFVFFYPTLMVQTIRQDRPCKQIFRLPLPLCNYKTKQCVNNGCFLNLADKDAVLCKHKYNTDKTKRTEQPFNSIVTLEQMLYVNAVCSFNLLVCGGLSLLTQFFFHAHYYFIPYFTSFLPINTFGHPLKFLLRAS